MSKANDKSQQLDQLLLQVEDFLEKSRGAREHGSYLYKHKAAIAEKRLREKVAELRKLNPGKPKQNIQQGNMSFLAR